MDGWTHWMDGYPIDFYDNGADNKSTIFHRVYCEEDWDLTANGRLYYRWAVDSAQQVPEPSLIPGISFDTRPDSVLKIIG